MTKTILITGANRGLGFSLTKLYLEKGYVVFSGLLNKASENILELKEQYGDRLNLVSMDVSSDALVSSSILEVRNHTDSIDILINNAGVHFEKSFAPLEEVDFEVAQSTLNINTLGPLRVTRAFIPFVRNGEEKVIVNISSEAGSIGQSKRDREFDYCMSKSALNMQSVLLQKYLRADGIKVLAVHPGFMKTDMGGPRAHITSETSAEGIYELINKYKGDLDAPIFMDYTGKLLNW